MPPSFRLISSLAIRLFCWPRYLNHHPQSTAISEIGFTSKCTMAFCWPQRQDLSMDIILNWPALIEGRCKYCMKERRTIQNYATSIKLKNTYFTLSIAPLVNLLQTRQTTHSCSRCLEDLPFSVNFPSLVWRLTCDSSYMTVNTVAAAYTSKCRCSNKQTCRQQPL